MSLVKKLQQKLFLSLLALSASCISHFCPFTYTFTQLPTQFYTDLLHPYSVSRIITLISWIPHIPTRILTLPPRFPKFQPPFPLWFPAVPSSRPWFPAFSLPFPTLPSFQPLFPHISLIPFPHSPFRLLQIVTFCYWHSIIYRFQKTEFIKWIVNASIVKQ